MSKIVCSVMPPVIVYDQENVIREASMKGNGWRTFQIIQLVLFLCFSGFLFSRTVDGHGAVQTAEVRLISFAIWAIFYIGLMAIEWLVYFIVRRCAK